MMRQRAGTEANLVRCSACVRAEWSEADVVGSERREGDLMGKGGTAHAPFASTVQDDARWNGMGHARLRASRGLFRHRLDAKIFGKTLL
jgi:hypothetical protein